MKVQHSIPDCSAERVRACWPAHEEISSAAQEASQTPDSAAQDASVVDEPAAQQVSDGPEPTAQQASGNSEPAASAPKASSNGQAQPQDDIQYVPLVGKDAESGAQRTMPDGRKGHFWCA